MNRKCGVTFFRTELGCWKKSTWKIRSVRARLTTPIVVRKPRNCSNSIFSETKPHTRKLLSTFSIHFFTQSFLSPEFTTFCSVSHTGAFLQYDRIVFVLIIDDRCTVQRCTCKMQRDFFQLVVRINSPCRSTHKKYRLKSQRNSLEN